MPALLNPLIMTLGVTHCIQDSVTNFTNREGVMLLPVFFARQSRCLFFSAAFKGLKTLRSRGWTTLVKWLGSATRCTPNFTASSMMALVEYFLLPSTTRTTALWGFAVGLVREANSLSHSIKMSSEDQPVLVAFTEIGQASC